MVRKKRGYNSYFRPVLRVHKGLELDRQAFIWARNHPVKAHKGIINNSAETRYNGENNSIKNPKTRVHSKAGQTCCTCSRFLLSHQFGPIMVTAHMIFIWSTPRAQSYENRKRLLIQQSGHWGLKQRPDTRLPREEQRGLIQRDSERCYHNELKQ